MGKPRTAEPLLAAVGLVKRYRRGRRPGSGRAVDALVGVDLALAAGTTGALVGRSGCGKSTLARCLALFESPDAGSVRYRGAPVEDLDRGRRRRLRRRIQLVLQDTAGAINPRFTALEAVTEPLRVAARGDRGQQRRRALALLDRVGIARSWTDRRPGELSGGQRQRVAIARALVLEPEVLILDEALAGLDLSVQAQVVNLLIELRERSPLALLYITHDLSLLHHLAARVWVMEGGEIVERGTPAALLEAPRHPATQRLVEAAPVLAGAALDAAGEAAPCA